MLDLEKFPEGRDVYTSREVCAIHTGQRVEDLEYWEIRTLTIKLLALGEIKSVHENMLVRWHPRTISHGSPERLFTIRNHLEYEELGVLRAELGKWKQPVRSKMGEAQLQYSKEREEHRVEKKRKERVSKMLTCPHCGECLMPEV